MGVDSMWNISLLEVKNPTDGQLIYMKDLYKEETLIDYMVWRWEGKFNRHMSEKDYMQYRHEIKLLNLDSFKVLSNMEDYYNI